MNKRKLLKWLILLASVVYVIVMIVLMVAITVYRFQNPTLTETQLLIAFAPYTIGFFIATFALGIAWRMWEG